MKDDLPPEFAGADVSSKTIKLTNNLYRYFKETSLREPEILQRLRLETRRCTSDPDMQISPEQGQFMQLLTRLMNPRKVLEVGVSSMRRLRQTCWKAAAMQTMVSDPPRAVGRSEETSNSTNIQ